MSDAPLPDAVQEIEAAHRAWVVAGDNPGSEFTRLADLYFRFGPALIAELQSAWAENERLREALRPFGRALFFEVMPDLADEEVVPFSVGSNQVGHLSLGNFRQARVALTADDVNALLAEKEAVMKMLFPRGGAHLWGAHLWRNVAARREEPDNAE